MALQEFVGAAILEVDSREIEVTKINVRASTGRRPVATMNKEGRAKGFSRGIATYELSVSAVIPADGSGEVDWAGIEGAKLTIEPVGGGSRVSYLDCFSTEVGNQYQVEGEAIIDITLAALRRVEE